MSKWKKTLIEPVSEQHESNVLKNVSSLLKQNSELAAQEKKAGSGSSWIYWALPAIGLAAMAFVLVPQFSSKRGGTEAPVAQMETALSPEMEIALEFEMYNDLQEIQNLELLKTLGDSDKWVTKKPKPRKT